MKAGTKLPSVAFPGSGSYLKRGDYNGALQTAILMRSSHYLLSAEIAILRICSIAEVRPYSVSGPCALGQYLSSAFPAGVLFKGHDPPQNQLIQLVVSSETGGTYDRPELGNQGQRVYSAAGIGGDSGGVLACSDLGLQSASVISTVGVSQDRVHRIRFGSQAQGEGGERSSENLFGDRHGK